MADLGLLGDRPGKSMDDQSLQIKLWNHMIKQTGPLSLDELKSPDTIAVSIPGYE